MGYDRNDRGYGREDRHGRDAGYGPGGRDRPSPYGGPGRDGGRGYGGDRDRGRGAREYGSPPQGYDYEERGFFDRAGDEVRSWFGDEEAERRRRYDERFAQRDYDRDRARYGTGAQTSAYTGYDGDFGAGIPASGYGLNDRSNSRGGGSNPDHDPNYRSWRDRQIEALDRDYEDYRREHQGRFDNEFTGWRGKRQGQRDSLRQVQEHQEVVGSDGQHVGKVDHVRGDRILLTKSDQNAGGHHHSIPSAWIMKVDEKVEIDRTAAQAQQAWKDEEDNSAIGGKGSGGNWSDDRSGGPRNLNRSFSGTY